MKDAILLGLAAFLVLRLTNKANAGMVSANNAGYVPSSNQNADRWLKAGALNVGAQLLKEFTRGSAAVLPAVSQGSGAVFDGWSNGVIVENMDSGGYW